MMKSMQNTKKHSKSSRFKRVNFIYISNPIHVFFRDVLGVLPNCYNGAFCTKVVLTLFRMGLSGLLTYSTMTELCAVVSYLKEIQKYIDHVTHHLSSSDISNFSLEIRNFCYIRKCR